MKESIEDKTRAEVAEFLHAAIKKAIESYKAIMEIEDKPPPENKDGGDGGGERPSAKKYKEQHDAARVALAHMKLLLEFARWADLPTAAEKDDELMGLIARAQEELGEGADLC